MHAAFVASFLVPTQADMANSFCTTCPMDMSTQNVGATSLEQCKCQAFGNLNRYNSWLENPIVVHLCSSTN